MRVFTSVVVTLCVLIGYTTVAVGQTYTPLVCSLPTTTTIETVSYTIPGTATTREVDIRIAEPAGLPAGVSLPLPTVIWSHGGAGGGTPQNLEAWRNATTEACYVSVTIGHAWPETPLNEEICDGLFDLVVPDECGIADDKTYKLLNFIRPHDIAAVMDYLEADYDDLVDETKFAIGGHSAGAGGAMMVAGATRAFRTGDAAEDYIEIRDLSDPRPIAFIAMSPQGPGADGFYEAWKHAGETSWDNVTRPILIGTGAGDNGCDQSPRSLTSSTIHYCNNLGPTPSNRKAVFDFLPQGPGAGISKYRFYIDHWRAAHTIFKLSENTCASGGGTTQEDHCDLMFEGLTRAVVGFLDWHVRGDPLAEDFLAKQANIPGSRGLFEWTRK